MHGHWCITGKKEIRFFFCKVQKIREIFKKYKICKNPIYYTNKYAEFIEGCIFLFLWIFYIFDTFLYFCCQYSKKNNWTTFEIATFTNLVHT